MKYDFIEIGTSDFDTLIEQATDTTVGLSIEPLKYYLDRLPDKPYAPFNEEKEETKPLRIMFLPSHLSTGGAPKFCQTRIEVLQQYTDAEIFVVEYQCYSLDFIVQRSAILKLVENKFTTLYEDKMELFRYIDQWKPDIIHIDEMSERMDSKMIAKLYSNDRKYRIIETCHDISFVPNDKKFQPDAYAFCTPYHLETFKNMKGIKKVIEFPIDNKKPTLAKKINIARMLGFDPLKKHVLNVGLWTKGKNQGEGIEIARRYPDIQFHFVGNQAGNFADYWRPLMNDLPENVKIWGEQYDVPLFLIAADLFMFNSTWECNPLVLREAISYNLPIISRNLPQYVHIFDEFINPIDSDLNDESLWKAKYEVPSDNESIDFANAHIDLYNQVCKIKVTPVRITTPLIDVPLVVSRHYVEKPYLRIENGISGVEYDIKFFDDKNKLIHQQKGAIGTWINLNRKWFTRWRTVVSLEGKVLYDETLDFTDKRIFIVFNSEALGDNIAWIPYCQAFKEKHKCEVIVSTYHNRLFKNAYPELIFAEPGETVHNVHAQYFIGWFFDNNKEPKLPNIIPLQQTASNILGLEWVELIPKITFVPSIRPIIEKYIVICTNSTCQMKFWTIEGWTKLAAYLNQNGYKVINVSKERNPIVGVYQIEDVELTTTMNWIYHSEFMIGLSSGLSWVANSLGKYVFRIGSFINDTHEFTINGEQISNREGCNGCWHTDRLDRGNWHHCPRLHDTDRAFECATSITSELVISKIKRML